MRAIRNFFLLSFSLLLMPQVMGQDQKIGFFESDYILEQIPEYNGIEQQLDVLSTQWRQEIRELENEIRELEEDYEAKEILYTEEIRNQKRQEIEQKIQAKERYITEKFGPQGEYFSRQKALLEPVQRQLFNAVRVVAEREQVDFVFDRSGDIYLVFANNEYNLNDEILEQLGIEINE
ncbi:OmpH family outer membrane protein [Gracilimonas halophila]|uniref:OmpH family outer membrane protein n=1 Tax=Gracilimonas halophila TaxID=1834464 RepID=A0ABW5JP28_9BACT